MFCAISGEVPTEPVVSSKSGHLFEKRLIEKYLASEDRCPVTGEPLTKADLLPLVAGQTARPRPITATSIPGLLSHFQNEWDAVMLEQFTLKQHLDTTRKELSQVLYQHDAACRVIARLMRERDEARAMLGAGQGIRAQQTAAAFAAPSGNAGMEDDPSAAAAAAGITDAVLANLVEKGKELSKGRKKRPIPATLASAADVASFVSTSSASPHATKTPGVLCVDLLGASVTVSGGNDKAAVVFDHAKGQVLASLAGHGKKVSAAVFHPEFAGGKALVLTGSADKSVKLWSVGSDFTGDACTTIGGFGGEVTGLSVHPTGDYCASSSKDGSWSFLSLTYGSNLATTAGTEGYNGCCFHPDGLLLGLASASGSGEIWDVKTQKKIHAFEGHSGAVNAIDFSENGYLMASTGADGTLKVWDLRKLKNLHTLDLPSAGLSCKFDYSGSFLGVGCSGGEAMVHGVKEWEAVGTLKGHTKEVNGLCFSKDANVIATASIDRTVQLWGAKR